MNDRARVILRTNDRGSYTVPTKNLYPFQWNWDSAFAAIGFSTFDIGRAWTELDTLLNAQREDGMVPHIVFHEMDEGYFPGPDEWGFPFGRGISGITQPPVAASCARWIFEVDPEIGIERIPPLFERLVKWHRWFIRFRCESAAVAITHPWESGRDNAPDWDLALGEVVPLALEECKRRDTQHVNAQMRPTTSEYEKYLSLVKFGRDCAWDENVIRTSSPFRVADPTMTFILLRANRDLSWLAGRLGKCTEEIDGWTKILEQGAQSLWNDQNGYFDAKNLRTGEFANSLSSASFLCWYAGVGNEKMRSHLEEVLKLCEFGVPSSVPYGKSFERKRYWRGPVWAIINIMVGIGLEENGLKELARRLRHDVRRLIATSGFAEYFDPIDGTPAGGDEFTWTAAAWLAWASPDAESRASWAE